MSFLRKQESKPIWIRVFHISDFPLQREQAWIPASAGMTFCKTGINIYNYMGDEPHL
jgi:hypothetical protein